MYEKELAELIRDEMDEHGGDYNYVTNPVPTENATFLIEFYDGSRFLVVVQAVQG